MLFTNVCYLHQFFFFFSFSFLVTQVSSRVWWYLECPVLVFLLVQFHPIFFPTSTSFQDLHYSHPQVRNLLGVRWWKLPFFLECIDTVLPLTFTQLLNQVNFQFTFIEWVMFSIKHVVRDFLLQRPRMVMWSALILYSLWPAAFVVSSKLTVYIVFFMD